MNALAVLVGAKVSVRMIVWVVAKAIALVEGIRVKECHGESVHMGGLAGFGDRKGNYQTMKCLRLLKWQMRLQDAKTSLSVRSQK